MNKLFLVLIAALISSNVYASILGSPFLPEEDKRFDKLENAVSAEAGNSGLFVSHHAKAIVAISASGTKNVGFSLPPNSIIQQAYWYMSSSGTPASGTTLAFQCDAANDIYSAADISAVATNTITAGVETGTAATMHYSSAGCVVKAVTGVHNPTMTVDLFIDYTIVK